MSGLTPKQILKQFQNNYIQNFLNNLKNPEWLNKAYRSRYINKDGKTQSGIPLDINGFLNNNLDEQGNFSPSFRKTFEAQRLIEDPDRFQASHSERDLFLLDLINFELAASLEETLQSYIKKEQTRIQKIKNKEQRLQEIVQFRNHWAETIRAYEPPGTGSILDKPVTFKKLAETVQSIGGAFIRDKAIKPILNELDAAPLFKVKRQDSTLKELEFLQQGVIEKWRKKSFITALPQKTPSPAKEGGYLVAFRLVSLPAILAFVFSVAGGVAGSVIPFLGTFVGAAIGAGLGASLGVGLLGLYQLWTENFKKVGRAATMIAFIGLGASIGAVFGFGVGAVVGAVMGAALGATVLGIHTMATTTDRPRDEGGKALGLIITTAGTTTLGIGLFALIGTFAIPIPGIGTAIGASIGAAVGLALPLMGAFLGSIIKKCWPSEPAPVEPFNGGPGIMVPALGVDSSPLNKASHQNKKGTLAREPTVNPNEPHAGDPVLEDSFTMSDANSGIDRDRGSETEDKSVINLGEPQSDGSTVYRGKFNLSNATSTTFP